MEMQGVLEVQTEAFTMGTWRKVALATIHNIPFTDVEKFKAEWLLDNPHFRPTALIFEWSFKTVV